jgi:hypothetical protein
MCRTGTLKENHPPAQNAPDPGIGNSPFKREYGLISQDKAIRLYIGHLNKPDKPVSSVQRIATYRAWRKFLERIKKPITTTAVSECIRTKKENQRNTDFEEELTLWKTELNNTQDVEHDVARILGTFRWNFARLDMTIHIKHTGNKTQPISEPILLAIHNALNQKDKDALELMAFGAERIGALGAVPLESVHLVEGTEVALLDVPADKTKLGERHPSAIPKQLAERLIERALAQGNTSLMRDIKDRFRRITKLAKDQYKVKLTSHYLRKRFETKCERIPSDKVNPNHWVILMGSKPTLGHMPDIYSLLSDRELVNEYQNEIIPRLELSGEDQRPQTTQLEALIKENAELKEQLFKLTKLLTEKLESKPT